MSDVKWIKLDTNIFDDEKILMIEALPSADSIIVIWFKLLSLAGKTNNDGVFIMNNRLAYTDEMLAAIFRRDVNTVRLALNTFETYGMIEIVDDIITIPNWNKHQTLDAYEKKKIRDRVYQQERREKQKLLIKSSDTSSDVAVSDKELDIEKEKRVINNSLKESRIEDAQSADADVVDYQSVVNHYNATCRSLPRVTRLSDKRKKAIRARLRKYGLDDVIKCFSKAEASDFLKGANNRNWIADFDWLMSDSNMAKVLDGKYDNRGRPLNKSSGQSNKFNDFNQRKYDFDALEKECGG